MSNTIIDKNVLDDVLKKFNVSSLVDTSIRQMCQIVDKLERETGVRYIRMELGNPGLPPVQLGVDAEIEALKQGIAAVYPDIQGYKPLKNEIKKFVKNFLDLDVNEENCLPTVGSMMGSFTSFMTLIHIHKEKKKLLFLDPGFPVHKLQAKVLGSGTDHFDVYNYRGKKLEEALEKYLSTEEFYGLIYSNPNNPSWIVFTDEELQIIAKIAKKYDVVVIEDLAYFGMDFRQDYGKPGVPPYQPTIGKYYDQYILLISSSKVFSYAGQRIGMMVVSPELFNRHFPDLKTNFYSDHFGTALIFESIYSVSSGTSHSPQYALYAILKAVNEGKYNFRDEVLIYGEKAKIMKKHFLENGFQLVYDKDVDKPIADGFYFTVKYPGLDGNEILYQLLLHGIGAISLKITGSDIHEGIRACVSLIPMEMMDELGRRLKIMKENIEQNKK